MNPKLRELLAACAVAGDDGAPLDSSRILVLQNWGPVPPLVRKRGLYEWNLGFNLLVLGPDGVPRYFAKCRPGDDDTFSTEALVLASLNRDPELRRLVPDVRVARCRELQLQVTEFIAGARYEFTVARLGEREWAASMSQILAVARWVSHRAAAVMPHLLGERSPIRLRAAAARALVELAAAGVSAAHLEVLDRVLARTPTVPRVLQHGDLWPANVLARNGGGWALLDFEAFGRIQTPLYDVCHFVRNCWTLRWTSRPGSPCWFDCLLADDREAETCRATLRRQALALRLGTAQALGAFVYYLVENAAQVRFRGAATSAWAPLVAEVERVADAVCGGVRLEQVVFGLAPDGDREGCHARPDDSPDRGAILAGEYAPSDA